MTTWVGREGWCSENGVLVHLASEAAVDGVPSVLDLDDEIVADGFDTIEQAQAYVERRWSTEGHVLVWRN